MGSASTQARRKKGRSLLLELQGAVETSCRGKGQPLMFCLAAAVLLPQLRMLSVVPGRKDGKDTLRELEKPPQVTVVEIALMLDMGVENKE